MSEPMSNEMSEYLLSMSYRLARTAQAARARSLDIDNDWRVYSTAFDKLLEAMADAGEIVLPDKAAVCKHCRLHMDRGPGQCPISADAQCVTASEQAVDPLDRLDELRGERDAAANRYEDEAVRVGGASIRITLAGVRSALDTANTLLDDARVNRDTWRRECERVCRLHATTLADRDSAREERDALIIKLSKQEERNR